MNTQDERAAFLKWMVGPSDPQELKSWFGGSKEGCAWQAWLARAALTASPAASPDAQDAARYRWLKRVAPHTLCVITWRFQAACQEGLSDEPDTAIDAAMRDAKK